MSYEEYNDLFIKAQQNDNAKYIAFVFDIKSSKLMDKRTRKSAQLKTFNTINLMIKYIKTLEVECKNKILINELPVLTTDNVTKPRNEMLSYLNNPCVVFGDSFAFYCYNNSIKTRDFIDIFMLGLCHICCVN